jgi:hypothetical protein
MYGVLAQEQYERFCAKVKEIDGNDAIYMYVPASQTVAKTKALLPSV